jgi:hypothetical protein
MHEFPRACAHRRVCFSVWQHDGVHYFVDAPVPVARSLYLTGFRSISAPGVKPHRMYRVVVGIAAVIFADIGDTDMHFRH